MRVRAVPARRRADAVAVAVPSDRIGRPVEGLDQAPWAFLKSQGFTGELGQCVAAPGDDGRAVLYVGVGPSGELGVAALRSAAAVAARTAARHRSLSLELGGAGGQVPMTERLQAQGEGAVLGAYRFAGYRSKPPDTRLADVQVVDVEGKAGKPSKAAIAHGVRLAEATCLARDLVNEPGGSLTAPVFGDRAVAESEASGVACTVHDEKVIRRMGLGGLLAVNRGSTVPPRFVELAWEPPDSDGSTPTVALVGKGVTFDSGGLSIKTAEGMTTMKCDMGGGAAVLATLAACRDIGVEVGVRGYIPLTDNMTGGDAQRVGDVITHYGGSTTEVLNTDAEGRLILADALAWATTARPGHAVPDAVLDVATLTGACMVGLGTRTAGLFANDDPLAERVLASAAGAGERLWRLPLVEADRKGLESKVADRKNVAGRYGGAITAGLFLRDFVLGGAPWAHLDIAGPAYNEGTEELEIPAGGTGFGVRTLLTLLRDWS